MLRREASERKLRRQRVILYVSRALEISKVVSICISAMRILQRRCLISFSPSFEHTHRLLWKSLARRARGHSQNVRPRFITGTATRFLNPSFNERLTSIRLKDFVPNSRFTKLLA